MNSVNIHKHSLLLLYITAIFTICSLYATQPIQPLLEKQFSLTRFQAVIFTTAMMLPLGVAPIVYGFFLESVSINKTLRLAVAILGLFEIIFGFSNHYILLLNLRGLQGLLVPAILTSLTGYISYQSSYEKVQHAMSVYIGITIVGGFLGRYFSGLFTDLFGWRIFFILLGVLLVATSYLLRALPPIQLNQFLKPKWQEIWQITKVPHNLYILFSMFLIFFIFQAVLNFMPFIFSTTDHPLKAQKISMLYSGYTVGVLVALNSSKVIQWFQTESNAMFWGGVIFVLSLVLFQIKSYSVFFLNMFLFCLGMFTVHSLAAGFLNKLAKQRKAIANGLYISFYYAGGTLGTFAPGVIYHYLGWHNFVAFLSLCSLFALALLYRLKKFSGISTHPNL